VNCLAPQEVRTYFITTVTANRRRLFQVESNAQLLFELLNEDRAKGRYQVHAFVFMPDHLHLLLTPAPDVSVEKAVQFIKGGFSFRLKSKQPVWEDSFTKLGMKDPASYDNHRNTSTRIPCARDFANVLRNSDGRRRTEPSYSMWLRATSGPEGPLSRGSYSTA
jgi:putative transposase